MSLNITLFLIDLQCTWANYVLDDSAHTNVYKLLSAMWLTVMVEVIYKQVLSNPGLFHTTKFNGK